MGKQNYIFGRVKITGVFMDTKQDLEIVLYQLREMLPYLAYKYNVASLELFGSYVKNQQDVKSDLDVLVTFSKTPGLIKFLELKNYLSDLLKINVDLVMKDSLKPGISSYILKNSVPV